MMKPEELMEWNDRLCALAQVLPENTTVIRAQIISPCLRPDGRMIVIQLEDDADMEAIFHRLGSSSYGGGRGPGGAWGRWVCTEDAKIFMEGRCPGQKRSVMIK